MSYPLDGDNIVADIGNGTMNTMRIYGNLPREDSLRTEKYGVDICVKKICAELSKESGNDFPEEVIEIQEGTFDNCKTLETVVLPSGITRIEERAFARCSGLQSINIPESVEDVAPGAFEDCDRLWNVQISEKTIEKLGLEKVRKLLITRAALVGFAIFRTVLCCNCIFTFLIIMRLWRQLP